MAATAPGFPRAARAKTAHVITLLLAEHLAANEDTRWDLLEVFARYEIAGKLALRPSFVQTLLQLVQHRLYERALEPRVRVAQALAHAARENQLREGDVVVAVDGEALNGRWLAQAPAPHSGVSSESSQQQCADSADTSAAAQVLAPHAEECRLTVESESWRVGTMQGHEAGALAAVHGSDDRTVPVVIGAAKASVGHTEASSGQVGLLRLSESAPGLMASGSAQLRLLNPLVGERLVSVDGCFVLPLHAVAPRLLCLSLIHI